MVFIDGGYLRELCKKYYGYDNIDFENFSQIVIDYFNTRPYNPFKANVIRIYYYDAIVEEGHPDYKVQREYFDDIRACRYYTVRLGTLVKSSKKKFKQKGVDILMAIDALTKAYQNQYDVGIFIMGDRDFVPLIEAVKNAGKKTFCVMYELNCPPELIRCFDSGVAFAKKHMESWLEKQP